MIDSGEDPRSASPSTPSSPARPSPTVKWTDSARNGDCRSRVELRYGRRVAHWRGTLTVGQAVQTELAERQVQALPQRTDKGGVSVPVLAAAMLAGAVSVVRLRGRDSPRAPIARLKLICVKGFSVGGGPRLLSDTARVAARRVYGQRERGRRERCCRPAKTAGPRRSRSAMAQLTFPGDRRPRPGTDCRHRVTASVAASAVGSHQACAGRYRT